MMIDGQMPQGAPAEGAEEHLAKLQEFTQSDEFGRHGRFRAHARVQTVLEARTWSAWPSGAAGAAAGGADGRRRSSSARTPSRTGNPGLQRCPKAAGQAQPMVNKGELLDESLPGAGGGGNQAVPA
jgi:hypothetical protein